MIQLTTPRPPLVYAMAVLSDRINVYQFQGEESFDELAFMNSPLVRIGNYHVFAALWVSANPATEGHIGRDPALGSMRIIPTIAQAASSRAQRS